MRNESPVGLATILAVAPAIIAGVIFVILLVINGGDVEKATQLTLGIVSALSLVGAGALRQWRSVAGTRQPSSPANVEIDGLPVSAHEGAER